MAVESAGCPYVKVPVPIRGRVLGVGDSDTLTCEQERGLRMEPPRGRPPAAEEDDGQWALRVQGRAPRVEQTARDVSGVVEKIDLAGGIVTRFGDGA